MFHCSAKLSTSPNTNNSNSSSSSNSSSPLNPSVVLVTCAVAVPIVHSRHQLSWDSAEVGMLRELMAALKHQSTSMVTVSSESTLGRRPFSRKILKSQSTLAVEL